MHGGDCEWGGHQRGARPYPDFVCDMGISGAALATVVSQICSFILLLYMGRRGGNIRIRYRNFTPTLAFIKEIIGGELRHSPGRDWQAWQPFC